MAPALRLGGEVLTAPSLDAKQAQLLAGPAAAQLVKSERSLTVPKHTGVLVELPGS